MATSWKQSPDVNSVHIESSGQNTRDQCVVVQRCIPQYASLLRTVAEVRCAEVNNDNSHHKKTTRHWCTVIGGEHSSKRRL